LTCIFRHLGVLRSGGAAADASANRRDFLQYALSLMRGHNGEHADSLPVVDVSAMKHVAYVFDSLIYYMRAGDMSEEANPVKDFCAHAIESSSPFAYADDAEDDEEMQVAASGNTSRRLSLQQAMEADDDDTNQSASSNFQQQQQQQQQPPQQPTSLAGAKARKNNFFVRSGERGEEGPL